MNTIRRNETQCQKKKRKKQMNGYSSIHYNQAVDEVDGLLGNGRRSHKTNGSLRNSGNTGRTDVLGKPGNNQPLRNAKGNFTNYDRTGDGHAFVETNPFSPDGDVETEGDVYNSGGDLETDSAPYHESKEKKTKEVVPTAMEVTLTPPAYSREGQQFKSNNSAALYRCQPRGGRSKCRNGQSVPECVNECPGQCIGEAGQGIGETPIISNLAKQNAETGGVINRTDGGQLVADESQRMSESSENKLIPITSITKDSDKNDTDKNNTEESQTAQVCEFRIEVDDQSSESVHCDVGHQQTTGRCHQEERHSEYQPVSQLTLNMLPADVRDELLFSLVQLLSALTVKITVTQISGRRSISQKFRPPLQGTGWLFDRPPEIDTIERSLRGIVYIATSSQLVMDNSEARSCIVEFSTEAAKFFRKVHLQCESVQHISSSGEVKTYLKCITEDTDFAFKLNMLQEQIRSLSDSLPLYVKDRLTNMAIVLGYFHGELAMSFSNSSIIRRKLVKEVIEGRERHHLKNIITCAKDKDYDTVQLLLFTAVTCPGCLGAPIITFKQCAQGSAQYSLNIWTHCGVMESFEFSCSSSKAYSPEKLVTCLEQRSITPPQTQENKTLDTQNDIWTEAQKSQSNQEQDAHTTQHQCAQSTGHQCTQSTQQEGIQTSQQQLNHEPRAETSHQQGTDPAPQTQQITPENFRPNSTNTQNEITAVTEAPSYPAYLTLSKRLESFLNWPATNNIFQPNDLAKNGFFYAGYSDCVRCYQCGLGLKSWKPGDDIVTEHKRFRPNCPFLKILTTGPGVSFPGNQDNSSSLEAGGQSRLPDCFNFEKSPKLPAHFKPNTDATVMTVLVSHNVSLTNIVSENSSSVDGPRYTADEQETEKHTASPPEVSTTNVNTTQAADLSEGQAHVTHDLTVRLLQQEHDKLQELMKCKVCRLNPIKSLFLPCGDLYSCEECASKLTSCPQCGKRILGTVTTYFT